MHGTLPLIVSELGFAGVHEVGDSMKRTLFAIGVACLAILGVVIARRHFADSKITAKFSPQAPGDIRHNAILDAYGKLPLSFEQNSGQTDPRVRYTDMVACTQCDLRDQLSSIDKPALIMAGVHDPITTPDDARLIHGGLRGSKLRLIDDAGHHLLNERATEINSAIDSFLAEL